MSLRTFAKTVSETAVGVAFGEVAAPASALHSSWFGHMLDNIISFCGVFWYGPS